MGYTCAPSWSEPNLAHFVGLPFILFYDNIVYGVNYPHYLSPGWALAGIRPNLEMSAHKIGLKNKGLKNETR